MATQLRSSPVASSSTPEKRWLLVTLALSLSRPLATAVAIFATLVLLGYVGHIEPFYRPIPHGSATHPLTALLLLTTALAIRSYHPTQMKFKFSALLAGAGLLVAAVKIWDILTGSEVSLIFTPFQSLVALELQQGLRNQMGLNTALMLISLNLSLLVLCFHQYILSQLMSFMTLAIPTISFTGYAYSLSQFYGQMSMVTAILGFVLATAALSLTSETGALRAILSPYIGGRIARIQTITAYAVPVFLGLLIVRSLSYSDTGAFGMFVVAICWFTIFMVGLSAIFQELADEKRRKGEKELIYAASHDCLTGLSNRKTFFQNANHEVERSKRSQTQLWLMALDLDHFKKINDKAGHAVGDQVLKAMGTVLKRAVRSVDIVSRIGGEEFAILLVDTTEQGALRVSESIRQSIESEPVPNWSDKYGPVTVSIGCVPVDLNQPVELALKAADDLLYQAKRGGRNRVVIESSPD